MKKEVKDHRIQIFENQTQWINAITNQIIKGFGEGNRLIGLAGGNTPRQIYLELSNNKEFLEQCTFFIVDERNVTQQDKDSNYLMIKENLFQTQNNIKNLYGYDTQLSANECIENYTKILEGKADKGLDLVILGIGNDGHFASIFLGFNDWKNKDLIIATETDDNIIKQRYSMTPSYLLKAKKIIVILQGVFKLKMLENLFDPKIKKENLPAKFLLTHKNLKFYYTN